MANLVHFRVVISIALLTLASSAYAEPVKMSKSQICHDTSSPNYSRTKHFTPFPSLDECLRAGGRLPKGHTGNNARTGNSAIPTSGYNRKKFDHWIDTDGDCINTRHELLMAQSTSTVDTGKNPCTAERGRWLDPYTGRTFHNARDLDVDHLVPLKWAWEHGANQWSDHQRRIFANDESNLFAVQASANREKGAKGALQWLPPDQSFHCQYVVRFKRIVLKYRLKLTSLEHSALDQLQTRKCSN